MSEQRPASGLARAAQAEPLTVRGLIAAVGGVLGIAEAVLPSLVFIVAYQVVALQAAPAAVSRDQLVPVVVPPLLLAALFVAVRLVRRQRVMTALGGAFGAALSAVLALASGNANQNFLPGLLVNVAYGVVFVASLLVRWPIVGVVVSFMMGDQRTWRRDPVKRRLYTWLTVVWVALFAIRLAVQLPLYLAGDQVVALGIAKIALGLPLYAPVLVLTILGVQAVYRRQRAAA